MSKTGLKEQLKIAIDQTKTAHDELCDILEAGNKLAEACHRVQSEYDGIHRLRLALSNWYKVRANEYGRGDNNEQ